MKGWGLALGLSLVVHAALFTFVALSPSPPAGGRVGVRGDAPVSFTTVEISPPPSKSAPVLPERSRGVHLLSGARKPEDATPLGQTAEAAEPEAGGSAPATEVAEVAETQGGTPSASHPDPLPGAQGEGAPDVTALVHARLSAAADRCYPAAARRFQQRGTVQLAFCTDANGAASSTNITQSSGAELLDAAARGCVLENAAPFPREAASRCFSVPVRFGLSP